MSIIIWGEIPINFLVERGRWSTRGWHSYSGQAMNTLTIVLWIFIGAGESPSSRIRVRGVRHREVPCNLWQPVTLSSFITDFSTIHFYFQITTAQSPIIIILRYMHGLTIFPSNDNLISASAKKKINVFLLFQPLKLKKKYYIFILWQTCLVFVWFACFDIDFNNKGICNHCFVIFGLSF